MVFCFLGPIFYHGNTINSDLAHTDLAPQAGFPLGTDDQGFDELGLLMKGGQAALEVGFIAAAIGIVIGMLSGATAGLIGGIVDSAMMRACCRCLPGDSWPVHRADCRCALSVSTSPLTRRAGISQVNAPMMRLRAGARTRH